VVDASGVDRDSEDGKGLVTARRPSRVRRRRLYSGRAMLATIGLGLVLATLTAVCIWSARNAQATSIEVGQHLRVASAHEAVLEAVESEHAAILHYLDAPTARDPRRYAAQQRASFEASRVRLADAARAVETLGDGSDRSVVEYVVVVENRYQSTVQAMFQAVDEGRLVQAHQLEREETGPAVESLLQLVRATSEEQRAHATSQMNLLEARSAWFVQFLPYVFGVAFLFLAGCWAILLSLQRHLYRQATALVHEKALVEGVIAATPTLVYWKDVARRYQGGSEAFLNLRSLRTQEDLLGFVDEDLQDPLGQELATIENEVLAAGEAVMNRQVAVKALNGQVHKLLLSVIPRRGPGGGIDGVIGAGADVTHISELERQLAIASRLESIGQLAAGIAHEINTPIQFISHNTRFVHESLDRIMAGLAQIEHLATDETVAAAAVQAVLDEIDVRFMSDEVPTALTESQDGLTRVAEIVRALTSMLHADSAGADRAW
jgi:signal transduction histidine kinase